MITKKRKSRSLRLAWEKFTLFDLVNYTFLILLVTLMAYPFYNSVILAFNNGKDALNGGIYLWPRQFTLENFAHVFKDSTIIRAFGVSLSRTVMTTMLNLLVTSMFAYATSKPWLKFRKAYLTLMIIAMYFSGGLIPSFLLIRDIGLYNSFFVYVIPCAFSVFNSFVFISFFKNFPESLEESARVDGASTARIFFRIVVPTSMPVFASITLFTAVGQWNAWYDNMLYVKKPELTTLSFMFTKMIHAQMYLQEQMDTMGATMGMGTGVTSMSLQLATMVVAVLPIMLLYPFLQKHFAQGVMIGSIKG